MSHLSSDTRQRPAGHLTDTAFFGFPRLKLTAWQSRGLRLLVVGVLPILGGAGLLGWSAPGAAETTRISEETEDPAVAWTEPGFRLQLRFGYENLTPHGSAPAMGGFAFAVEPSFRTGEYLSVGTSLRYGIMGGDWVGVHWSGTLDLTAHPLRAAYATLGLGYSGLSVSDIHGGSADGLGPVATARLGYLFVKGDLFATGPVVDFTLHAVRCDVDEEEAYDGSTRTGHDWWWHHGYQITWAFTWR